MLFMAPLIPIFTKTFNGKKTKKDVKNRRKQEERPPS